MKIRIGIYPIICTLFFLIFVTGCKKENDHSAPVTNSNSTAVLIPGSFMVQCTTRRGIITGPLKLVIKHGWQII